MAGAKDDLSKRQSMLIISLEEENKVILVP